MYSYSQAHGIPPHTNFMGGDAGIYSFSYEGGGERLSGRE